MLKTKTTKAVSDHRRSAIVRGRLANDAVLVLSWLVVSGGKCLLLLTYIAAVWAFGTYDSEIATPWTLGFVLLWMAFGLVAAPIAACFLSMAPGWSALSILGLVIAVPYYSQAITVLVTLFFAFLMMSPFVWIPLGAISLATVLIYYWNTGGIGL